jgi:hypothetical protein
MILYLGLFHLNIPGRGNTTYFGPSPPIEEEENSTHHHQKKKS